MEWLRKKFVYIVGLIIVLVVVATYFFFYNTNSDNPRILETLNTDIVATAIIAVLFGLVLYHLESKRGTNKRRLEQRLELRNRSLECYEAVKILKIKIIISKMLGDHDYKDIAINFEQIKSYFTVLQKVYKRLPGDVALVDKLEKLIEFYNGWEKYFLLERPEDLEKFKNSIRDAEGYLDCLSKALLEYISSLQLE